MERLSKLIEERVRTGAWKAIKASKGGPSFSHLLLANDILLFVETSDSQIDLIKVCLDNFCMASSQLVNFSKPSIYFSPNITMQETKRLCERLEMTTTTYLGKYLGLFSYTKEQLKELTQTFFRELKARLDDWKSNHLSMAKQITLAKAVFPSSNANHEAAFKYA